MESGSTNISRARLRDAPSRTLRDGRSIKADLRVYDLDGAGVVVKDFHGKPWWARLLGRFQLRRERKAYARLAGLAGFPRCYGWVDRDALALEWIDGSPIDECREHPGEALFGRLARIVAAMHERGLLHWDLRARRNILVTRAGDVFVVDLASSMRLPRTLDPHGPLARRLRFPDRSAMIKWKRHCLGAAGLTAEERRFRDRFESWRRYWIFNPKRVDLNE